MKDFIVTSCDMKRISYLPFCQHFEFLSVRLDVVQSQRKDAILRTKSGQIAYPHTFPCGFFPKFRLRKTPFCLLEVNAGPNFSSIINEFWSPDIFSRLASEMPNKET